MYMTHIGDYDRFVLSKHKTTQTNCAGSTSALTACEQKEIIQLSGLNDKLSNLKWYKCDFIIIISCVL